MILKKEVITRLSKELSLPYTGVEQDWDLEMGNSKRIDDFVSFYLNNNLSADEKFALMSLILASYDNYLNENELEIENRWMEIKKILTTEKKIFVELFEYWSLNHETSDDNKFKITPLIRSLNFA